MNHGALGTTKVVRNSREETQTRFCPSSWSPLWQPSQQRMPVSVFAGRFPVRYRPKTVTCSPGCTYVADNESLKCPSVKESDTPLVVGPLEEASSCTKDC